jgi:4-hydroxy-3-methylbut-2-enyl diphosphate reductase IspH
MAKTIDFRKAAKDIKKLLKETHNIKQIKNSFDYKGADLFVNTMLVHSNTLKESMQEETVEFDKDDGYDMLDTIIYKALQIGYQNALIERGEN